MLLHVLESPRESRAESSDSLGDVAGGAASRLRFRNDVALCAAPGGSTARSRPRIDGRRTRRVRSPCTRRASGVRYARRPSSCSPSPFRQVRCLRHMRCVRVNGTAIHCHPAGVRHFLHHSPLRPAHPAVGRPCAARATSARLTVGTAEACSSVRTDMPGHAFLHLLHDMDRDGPPPPCARPQRLRFLTVYWSFI